jgi:hypothetical protein
VNENLDGSSSQESDGAPFSLTEDQVSLKPPNYGSINEMTTSNEDDDDSSQIAFRSSLQRLVAIGGCMVAVSSSSPLKHNLVLAQHAKKFKHQFVAPLSVNLFLHSKHAL